MNGGRSYIEIVQVIDSDSEEEVTSSRKDPEKGADTHRNITGSPMQNTPRQAANSFNPNTAVQNLTQTAFSLEKRELSGAALPSANIGNPPYGLLNINSAKNAGRSEHPNSHAIAQPPPDKTEETDPIALLIKKKVAEVIQERNTAAAAPVPLLALNAKEPVIAKPVYNTHAVNAFPDNSKKDSFGVIDPIALILQQKSAEIMQQRNTQTATKPITKPLERPKLPPLRQQENNVLETQVTSSSQPNSSTSNSAEKEKTEFTPQPIADDDPITAMLRAHANNILGASKPLSSQMEKSILTAASDNDPITAMLRAHAHNILGSSKLSGQSSGDDKVSSQKSGGKRKREDGKTKHPKSDSKGKEKQHRKKKTKMQPYMPSLELSSEQTPNASKASDTASNATALSRSEIKKRLKNLKHIIKKQESKSQDITAQINSTSAQAPAHETQPGDVNVPKAGAITQDPQGEGEKKKRRLVPLKESFDSKEVAPKVTGSSQTESEVLQKAREERAKLYQMLKQQKALIKQQKAEERNIDAENSKHKKTKPKKKTSENEPVVIPSSNISPKPAKPIADEPKKREHSFLSTHLTNQMDESSNNRTRIPVAVGFVHSLPSIAERMNNEGRREVRRKDLDSLEIDVSRYFEPEKKENIIDEDSKKDEGIKAKKNRKKNRGAGLADIIGRPDKYYDEEYLAGYDREDSWIDDSNLDDEDNMSVSEEEKGIEEEKELPDNNCKYSGFCVYDAAAV